MATKRSIRRPLRDSNPFLLWHVRWHVPRAVRGRLRFLRPIGRFGREPSPLRWARLVVR